MRVLHTADWHLGHTLHGLDRRLEHRAFLKWLSGAIGTHEVDALVIAGDVFDAVNPPAHAEEMFFEFLAEIRRQYRSLEIVIVAGNHDSSARMDAPRGILRAAGVHVIGALPRTADHGIDLGRLLIPLRDRSGRVAAQVLAVPFLRPGDLRTAGFAEGADPLIEGVRAMYAELLSAAAARLENSQALIATGHCYMTGTSLSRLSERKILGGNQHALPIDIFGHERLAYVALGHLHLAQAIGGSAHVRYSGSAIPLSLEEATYDHQVCLVEFDGPRFARALKLSVPRAVEILRVPEGSGALGAKEAMAVCKALPERAEGLFEAARPYLEVHIAVEGPEPSLRRDVEAALEGKAARLVRLVQHRRGGGQALAESAEAASLMDLTPDDVMRMKWRSEHEGEPPPALLEAFHEIVEAAYQDRRAGEGSGGA